MKNLSTFESKIEKHYAYKKYVLGERLQIMSATEGERVDTYPRKGNKNYWKADQRSELVADVVCTRSLATNNVSKSFPYCRDPIDTLKKQNTKK